MPTLSVRMDTSKREPEVMPQVQTAIGSSEENVIPYGYCHCGCGSKTKIILKNDKSKNETKGDFRKFKQGHRGERKNGHCIKGHLQTPNVTNIKGQCLLCIRERALRHSRKPEVKAKRKILRSSDEAKLKRKFYLSKNKDKINERNRIYRSKNKDKCKTSSAKSYIKNRQKHIAWQKKWASENKERANAIQIKYRKTNQQRINLKSKERCDNMAESYIANMMKIPVSEVPELLLTLKRAHLTLKREIQNASNNNNL